MKKILFALITISYIISSYIFIQYFETKEMIAINSGADKTPLEVVEWNHNERPLDKLSKIGQLAEKQKVNIYKFVYRTLEKSEKPKIIVYVATGDIKTFTKQFPLKWGRAFTATEPSKHYLSSIEENRKNQIGGIGLFSPENIFEIRPITAAEDENIRGLYIIHSSNAKQVAEIKEKLDQQIGLDIKPDQSIGIKFIFSYLASSEDIHFFMIVLIILLILICLSFLYYILLNYKELAIRKMFGSTYAGLMGQLCKVSVQIHGIALGSVWVALTIFLFLYNGLNQFGSFTLQWLAWMLAYTFMSVLLSFLPFLMVYLIKMKDMLKNRKPLKTVQLLNYSSKFIFSSLLILMSVQLFTHYQEFVLQHSNQEKWNTAKKYSFYEYQDNAGKDRFTWQYETGLKSKKLFELASKRGAILIHPTSQLEGPPPVELGPEFQHKKVPNYDPEEGNTIGVNSNYLQANPVYDLQGRKIQIKDHYGDYLLVLVPNQYRRYESKILKTYQDWYQSRKYTDEDIFNNEKGKKVLPHPKVAVKIVYIQDGQKHFLYHPEFNKEQQNYSKDSVLAVVNSEHMGGDVYSCYLTGAYFYPYKDNHLRKDIISAGLGDTILSTPLLYSKVDKYFFDLKNQIRLNLILSIVLLLMEMVITVFMVLNYLERNRFIHAIKKIHGFSFYQRHIRFFIILSLFWIMMGFGGLIFKYFTISSMLLVSLAGIVIEWIILTITIKCVEANKTKDILKGA